MASISSFSLTRTLGDTRIVYPRPRTPPASAADSADAPEQGPEAGVPPFRPPTEPSGRRIVGACFHELKARAMTVAAAAAAATNATTATAASSSVRGDTEGEEEEGTGMMHHDRHHRHQKQQHQQQSGESDVTASGRVGVGLGDTAEVGEHGSPSSGGITADRVAHDSSQAVLTADRPTPRSARKVAGRADGAPGGVGGERAEKGGTVLEPWLLPLVTRPAGFLVEVDGAVVRAGHGRALGKRLDGLVLQTKALAVALAEMPGRCVAFGVGRRI